MGRVYADAQVSTVFIGGGTPLLVPMEGFARVLQAVRTHFSLQPDVEYTVEANPGTLQAPWLEAALRGGINRLSLGVQARQDGLLARIGRIHSFAQAQEAVSLARALGVRNLNVDVMFGLPGQTPDMYRETLDAVLALAPEHISAYSLIVEEGTPLCQWVQSGEMPLPDEAETAAMYEQGAAQLEQAGYARYEVSNFARPGFCCRHNVGYWQGAWYLGLGMAAHSMLPPTPRQAAQGAVRIRRANTGSLEDYIAALNERDALPPATEECIGAQEAMFESMMLGLRMVDGVSEHDFTARHGVPMTAIYGDALHSLVRDGLACWLCDPAHADSRRFALTPRGMEVQNTALLRLMP